MQLIGSSNVLFLSGNPFRFRRFVYSGIHYLIFTFFFRLFIHGCINSGSHGFTVERSNNVQRMNCQSLNINIRNFVNPQLKLLQNCARCSHDSQTHTHWSYPKAYKAFNYTNKFLTCVIIAAVIEECDFKHTQPLNCFHFFESFF